MVYKKIEGKKNCMLELWDGLFNFAYSFLGLGFTIFFLVYFLNCTCVVHFGCLRSLQLLGSKMEKSELKVRTVESKYL